MSSCHHVNSHLSDPRLPLLYTWRRDNGPIPQKASFLDDRRVLILPDAQVEDSGNYTCRVERAGRATDTRTISLLVQGRDGHTIWLVHLAPNVKEYTSFPFTLIFDPTEIKDASSAHRPTRTFGVECAMMTVALSKGTENQSLPKPMCH